MRQKGSRVDSKPRFNAHAMRQVMLAAFEDFIPLGVLHNSEDTRYPGRHIYIDRGSNILGVAHLDSVQKASHFWISDERVLSCPTIDNRLGAWILLHGLPSIGIYPDVLLTEGEEKGMSTAADFSPEGVRWNWGFSFDRTGVDTVLYQYGDGDLEKALVAEGVKIGVGSYSCIASMDQLKLECFNMGCGMMDYHGPKAWADLDVVESQLLLFSKVYEKIKDTKFTYTSRNSWRKRGKRGHETTHITYYNGAWSGEGMGWEDYKYTPKRTSLPSQADNQRFGTLMRGLRIDFEKVMLAYNSGLEYFLSDDGKHRTGEGLVEWRDAHVLPDGYKLKGKEYSVHCTSCGHHFLWADTCWSTYFTGSYCKSCWLLTMDWLRLLPTDWEKELEVIDVLEVLT
jgi:hypothetical protein